MANYDHTPDSGVSKGANLSAGTDTSGIQIVERDGDLRVSSREVAENFGKAHKNVLQAIKNMECSEDFARLNFQPSEYIDPTGRSLPQMLMTRDGFTFLVMGFTGKDAAAWKEKYIAAFNAMEARLRNPVVLSGPQLMAAALIEADATMKAQAKQIEAMRGDVEALDRITKADGSLCITDAAKALQVHPKDLFSYLRENGWIYKRPGAAHDLGYQAKAAAGLLEHKLTTVLRADGSEKVTEQVRVTPKGLAKLAKLIQPTAKLIGGAV
ncbi:MAG: phage regulatory protein/antirepressor Ant [Paracoccus sp. (in: a-proteobacteria)]|nr:phage regulatory protein/antirepressor Ant [Paracoccus sp. (in: a-proteobacteria)]